MVRGRAKLAQREIVREEDSRRGLPPRPAHLAVVKGEELAALLGRQPPHCSRQVGRLLGPALPVTLPPSLVYPVNCEKRRQGIVAYTFSVFKIEP